MRALRWMLGVTATAIIVYLVVANVVLMTSLGPRLLSSPSARTHLDWARGYSVLPMRVHLRDVSVRIEGERATWRIASGRVEATVSPLALIRGDLHLRSAHAEDVTVIGEGVVTTPRARGPSSRSLADAPIVMARKIDERYTAAAGSDGAQPIFVIDELSADHVREVRVGALAYRGDAAARGSLRVFDHAPARVEHARAEARSGELDVGGAALLTDVRGHLTMSRHEVDTDAEPSRAWLGAIDGGLELEAAVMTEAIAAAGARLPETRGSLRTSLRVVDGVLAPGSTAALHVPTNAGGAPAPPPSADLALGVADDGGTTFGGVVRDVGWRGAATEGVPVAVASTVRVDGQSPRVRVAEPLQGAIVSVAMDGARVDPSRVPILRALVRGEPSSLRGSAHAVMRDRVATGGLTARAESVDLTLGERVFPGALDVDAELRSWRVGSSEAHLHVRATHAGRGDGAVASLDLEDAVVHFGTARSVDASAAVEMSSALPALDAVARGVALPPLIAAVASTQPLEASATLHANPHGIWLRDIRASAGLIAARGAYAKQDEGDAATLLLEAGPLAVGVSVDGPQTSLIFADPRAWFAAATTGADPAPQR